MAGHSGGVPWTKGELAELRQMMEAGATRAEIGDRLGRSVDSVQGQMKALGTGIRRVAGDDRQARRCLKCRKPFASEGLHNRICPACKSLNAGIVSAGPVDCGHRAMRARVTR